MPFYFGKVRKLFLQKLVAGKYSDFLCFYFGIVIASRLSNQLLFAMGYKLILLLLLPVSCISISEYPHYTRNINKIDIQQIELVSDSAQLKLPFGTIDIGLKVTDTQGNIHTTKGYLGGKLKWSKILVEVSDGLLKNGRINLKNTKSDNKYLIVKAFKKRDKEFLMDAILSYNFITDLQVCPSSSFVKAPGSQIDFKILLKYDNGHIIKYDSLGKYKKHIRFINEPIGGSLRKNRLQIYKDPRSIINHTVGIKATLLNDLTVSNSYECLLDYRKDYSIHKNGLDGSDGACKLLTLDGSKES